MRSLAPTCLMTLLLILALQNCQACYFAGPRVDCGFVGMSQAECESQGCCWQPAEFPGSPHIDLPWCFKPNNQPSEYKVTSATAATNLDNTGSTSGSDKIELGLELSASTLPELGQDIKHLHTTAEEKAPGIVRIRIVDADQPRWQVPETLFRSEILNRQPPPPPPTTPGKQVPQNNSEMDIEWDENHFALRVIHQNTGRTLWNSTGLRLVYKNQYLELSSWVESTATFYGAGERASDTLHLVRNGMPRTLWNHDLGPTFLEQNSYGSHPFVLALAPDGTAWGYFMLNSNAMDIIPTSDRLSFRLTGGTVDLFILSGPTPAAVLDQLTQIVGRPAMMPYWSLGWQQCKYGYQSIWEVEEVVDGYANAGIPLEVQWTDIDYMQRWKDFTFDPMNFPIDEMKRFVEKLKIKGQQWVPIVDPGILVEEGYEAYEVGLRDDVFLKGLDGRPYLGWVWPGATHFPDFMSERGRAFFKEFLAKQYEFVPWSGIWIDMNEASNFCTGDFCTMRKNNNHQQQQQQRQSMAAGDDPPPWVCQLECADIRPQLNASMLSLLDPPYAVSNSLQRLPLGTKSISVLATNLDGSIQYDTHNLYGFSECIAAYDAAQNITGKRPFVLSRSSFTGLGAYAAHWSGDNAASWSDMERSIPAVLSYGLFGMPFGGADVCGFQGDTNEELCARWIALAAVGYPFARSHSDIHSSRQEPYLWASVAETARVTLSMRYSLLPYWYTAMRTSHASGTPIMRPMWLNYPTDAATHTLDKQFMIGDSLLVIPVLEAGKVSVTGYFPKGTIWYLMFDEGHSVDTREGAVWEEVPAPLTSMPLYTAGGSIVPMQSPAMTTTEVKESPLRLLVALKEPVVSIHETKKINKGMGVQQQQQQQQQRAVGSMYNDGGEEVDVGPGVYNFLSFQADVEFNGETNTHKGVLEVSFGSTNATTKCSASNLNDNGDIGHESFAWPTLAGAKILGWHRKVDGGVRMKMVHYTDDCSEQIVDPVFLKVIGGGEHLEFEVLNGGVRLECCAVLRFTWQSSDSEVGDKPRRWDPVQVAEQ